MRLGELPRDAAVERGVIPLLLRFQRECRELQRVENVAEVKFCERAAAVVVASVPLFPSADVTCTTIAVMLSSPPRPFASEISASTTRPGVAREKRSC